MSSRFGGGGNKCVICDKTAYPAETITFEKIPYHVECFRCITCNKKMEGAAKAAQFDSKIYCLQCFQKGGFAQKQKNVQWTKKESAGGASSKFGGGGSNCKICDKTVYPAETVSYEKEPYHTECFKCSKCSKKMTPSGAAAFEGELFCTKCFGDGGYRQKQAASAKKSTGASGASASSKFGGGGAKCYICTKTVYAAETIQYEKKPFHEECFKCSNCQKKLASSGAEARKDGDDITVYCKKCWKELGINRAQTKTTDSPAEDEAPAEEATPAEEEAPAEEATYAEEEAPAE